MKKIIGLMGILVLFAATAEVAQAKKGSHRAAAAPQTTAPQGAAAAPADATDASQAMPQGGAPTQAGTTGAPLATPPGGSETGMGVGAAGATGIGVGAPQGVMGAPIGHRQPTAADVPPQERNPNDPMTKEDEALDKKLKSICKGC